MKTIVLTLALLFFPLTNISAQWEIINDGSDLKGSLNTIDFVNENVGWIAMSSGMLQTTDGGQNWNLLYVDENFVVSQIDFISELSGWAIGSTSTRLCIWKTKNGGQSWILTFSSAYVDFVFSSVFAIDSLKAFVVGGNRIYKTTNGGFSWINVAPGLPSRNYNSIWFQDSQTGVVTGNYNDGVTDRAVILKTTNGGTTWTETIVNEFNSIYDLQFLDALNGYFRANKDTAHFICKTVDMFTSWNVITQVISPDSWKNPIPSYQFINNNLAYAILDTSGPYRIIETTDGGSSWQEIQTAKYINLFKIYISKKNYSFILGSVSAFFASSPVLLKKINTDEWIIQKFTVPLKDVCFWDNNKGIYIGDYPGFHSHGFTIFSTSNGGITSDVSFGSEGSMNSCFFTNENVAIALGGSVIYRTNDFGTTWNIVYSSNSDSLGYSFYGYDISFFNDQNGFAVGEYSDSIGGGAGILISTNGGDSWNLGWILPNIPNYYYYLLSIHIKNNIGWSVGGSGIIVKYTPQTGWVQQTSVTDLPLNKVFFSDDNHGWIAGGYDNEHRIFLKTTNGGANWSSVPNIPYFFREIVFIDNNLGWAIGYDSNGVGGILETIDGGLTWSIDTGNLPAQLNALYIKDGYGWAVGENGLILRTTNAGAVWVEDENNNSLPTEFTLEQNYPNPFNPSTVIRYSLSVNSFVSLKVYDVLGREIKTLVNKEQPSGSYEERFTINDEPLTSGVYLYRLTAGSYTATKKMLLLK